LENRGILIFVVLFTFIIVSLILGLFIWLIVILVNGGSSPIKTKRAVQLNALLHTTVYHAGGLPLPSDDVCNIYLCQDKIIIESNNNISCNLLNNKIYDIGFKTDVDVQTFYASSAGAAIHGALHHGHFGGLSSGRIRRIRDVNTTEYIIITYNNDGRIDYLTFRDLDRFRSIKFVKEFNRRYPNKPKVEVQL
jgi:hypothetical protein